MAAGIKKCPSCGTLCPIDFSLCTTCNHRFRTQFGTANPDPTIAMSPFGGQVIGAPIPPPVQPLPVKRKTPMWVWAAIVIFSTTCVFPIFLSVILNARDKARQSAPPSAEQLQRSLQSPDRIAIGMGTSQVLKVAGEPDRSQSFQSIGGNNEAMWYYGSTQVVIKYGMVTAINRY